MITLAGAFMKCINFDQIFIQPLSSRRRDPSFSSLFLHDDVGTPTLQYGIRVSVCPSTHHVYHQE